MTRCSLLFLAFLQVGCAQLAQSPPAVDVRYGYPAGERIEEPGERGEEIVGLVAGSRAELTVFRPPTELRGGIGWVRTEAVMPVELTGAESSRPDVVRVVEARGPRLTLEAGRPGSAMVRLATADGEDQMDVRVAEPSEVTVSHLSPDQRAGEERVFLAGGVARFRMVRRDAQGRLLGGGGVEPPIHPDPPGAATWTQRDGDPRHLDVRFERRGEVVIRPLGGAPVPVLVVAGAPVTDFGVRALGADPTETEPLTTLTNGEEQLVVLWLAQEDGTRVYGFIERARLVSVTPDLCEVERLERFYGEGAYAIRPLAVGECVLDAYFDDRTTTLAVPVEPSTSR